MRVYVRMKCALKLVGMLQFVNMMCVHTALPEPRAAHAGPVHISPVWLTLTYLTSDVKIHCLSSEDILHTATVWNGIGYLRQGCLCEGISLLRKNPVRSAGLSCFSPTEMGGLSTQSCQ